ncbi:hypothetical protein E2542_SST23948 [Spatholobus suberectus]|nr:hypothetical protein E2542_SST23948 [Spatholobus suberectus]
MRAFPSFHENNSPTLQRSHVNPLTPSRGRETEPQRVRGESSPHSPMVPKTPRVRNANKITGSRRFPTGASYMAFQDRRGRSS